MVKKTDELGDKHKNKNKQKNFYNTIEDATQHKYNSRNTNLRYPTFTQTHFTAGDKNQFNSHRLYDTTIGQKNIDLVDNLFINDADQKFAWEKYINMSSLSIDNTFNYIFNKFKKGIFISIRNNELKVFLPFSNVNYTNEWHPFIKFNIEKATDVITRAQMNEGRSIKKLSINQYISKWTCNNMLVRYEYPLSEGDSGIHQMCDMFTELCKHRKVPDVDLFINKRDFPLLTLDDTEPYTNVFRTETSPCPLLSHKYDHYCPILSMTSGEHYADIAIPTWEDWSRVSNIDDNKIFPKPAISYKYNMEHSWENKKDLAVFRGASTGGGIDINTNHRLRLVYLSTLPEYKDCLDVGITKWNCRPRLVFSNGMLNLKTIDTKSLPFELTDELSPEDQSKYRYIINVPGHSCAYRLSLEMSMKSVIFLVDFEYKLWYTKYLVPYVHYIPIKGDMSDLSEKIEWCRIHQKECIDIADASYNFYTKYLCKDAIFDYLQNTLVNIAKYSGVPLYNKVTHDIYPPAETSATIKSTTRSTARSTTRSTRLLIHDRANSNVLRNTLVNTLIDIDKQLITQDGPTINTFATISRVFAHNSSLLPKQEWLRDFVNKSRLLFSTKTNKVYLHSINNIQILVKELLDMSPDKLREFKYSYTVGNELNNLSNEIGNFAIMLGHLDNIILQQYINGTLMFDWLKSDDFSLNDYYGIMIQLALALNIAYEKTGFIHNDLFPWNIILKKYSKPHLVVYRFMNKIISIKTTIVPIIIDFGKSNIIIDNYYYTPNKNAIQIQDILSIMISSLHVIVTNNNISKHCCEKLLKFANYISNTRYTDNKKFTSLKSLKTFTYDAKKYNNIIFSEKYELKNKSLFNFINFMLLNFSDDIYLISYHNLLSTINVDNILINNTSDSHKQHIYNHLKYKFENFLKTNITINSNSHILKFYKTYQNIYTGLKYIHSYNKDEVKEITQLYNQCIDKLMVSFNEAKKQFTKKYKKYTPVEYISKMDIFNNTLSYDNLSKIYIFILEYDFSTYNILVDNKIIYNMYNIVATFDDTQLLMLPSHLKKEFHISPELNHLINIDYNNMIEEKTMLINIYHELHNYMDEYNKKIVDLNYNYEADTIFHDLAQKLLGKMESIDWIR